MSYELCVEWSKELFNTQFFIEKTILNNHFKIKKNFNFKMII